MQKIILIERDASKFMAWKNLARKNEIQGLSVEQVVRKYKGFEGDILEVYEIKNDKNDQETIQELLKFKDLGSCFLLYIRLDSSVPSYIETHGLKLGYDVGVCAEEGDEVYSSIFHEILFGIVEELIAFKETLNENFLFNNIEIAEKYVETHNEMSSQGRDVEDYMPMVIYEIWNL